MDVIGKLFSTYSIESLIFIILMLAVSIRFVDELISWFDQKAKQRYENSTQQDNQYQDLLSEVKNISNGMSNLEKEMRRNDSSLKNSLDNLYNKVDNINSGLMESVRNTFLDKHRTYMDLGYIPELELQSLEGLYTWYTQNGGNSFVSKLMSDIRTLPMSEANGQKLLKEVEEDKCHNN